MLSLNHSLGNYHLLGQAYLQYLKRGAYLSLKALSLTRPMMYMPDTLGCVGCIMQIFRAALPPSEVFDSRGLEG